MECGHTCGIDRQKRQADRTLLFEYITKLTVHVVVWSELENDEELFSTLRTIA